MAFVYSPKIITNGLVLALDAADRNSYPGSGTTWSDLSGTGNNGTLTNGPTFNSGNGGSIVFDGTNDYVTIPDNNVFDFGTGDFAIEVWAYFTTLAGNAFTGPTMVVLRNYYTGNNGFAFYITKAGKMSIYTTSFFSEANASVVINKWQQLIFTRISGVGYLYNNADLRDSRAFTLNVLVNNRVDIGFDTQFNSDPLTGRVSSVKIYSGKGLTANEVLQNYNAQKSRYGL